MSHEPSRAPRRFRFFAMIFSAAVVCAAMLPASAATTAPVNDDWDAKTFLRFPRSSFWMDVTGSTLEAGEPRTACDGRTRIGRSVWFAIETRGHDVTIDATASDYSAIVRVMTNDALKDSTTLACGPTVSFPSVDFGMYFIQVSSPNGETGSALRLEYREKYPPNDHFADASVAAVLPYQDFQIPFYYATTEPGEPAPTCQMEPEQPVGPSVWYRYTESTARVLKVELLTDTESAVIQSYVSAGPGFEGLRPVFGACANSRPGGAKTVSLAAVAGATYYFQLIYDQTCFPCNGGSAVYGIRLS